MKWKSIIAVLVSVLLASCNHIIEHPAPPPPCSEVAECLRPPYEGTAYNCCELNTGSFGAKKVYVYNDNPQRAILVVIVKSTRDIEHGSSKFADSIIVRVVPPKTELEIGCSRSNDPRTPLLCNLLYFYQIHHACYTDDAECTWSSPVNPDIPPLTCDFACRQNSGCWKSPGMSGKQTAEMINLFNVVSDPKITSHTFNSNIFPLIFATAIDPNCKNTIGVLEDNSLRYYGNYCHVQPMIFSKIPIWGTKETADTFWVDIPGVYSCSLVARDSRETILDFTKTTQQQITIKMKLEPSNTYRTTYIKRIRMNKKYCLLETDLMCISIRYDD